MRTCLAAAVVLAVAGLLLPVLTARPAALSSDESLYLAEGYNIAAGSGPKYTSQEVVNHRAPLYPALLAVPLRLTGDPDSAYWVSRFAVVGLVLATFLVARQLFGALAGGLAALLVASNAFLRWLGTTLFLDGAETLFLLLLLAALWRAFAPRSSPAWFVLAALAYAAAFYTKETAVQWLALPFVFALLSVEHRTGRVARGLGLFAATSASLMAVWWVWVYLATGRVYFWGPPDARLAAWCGAALGTMAVAGAVWLALRRWRRRPSARTATAAGLLLLAGWVVALTFFLESTSWPYPVEHWRTVPHYLWQVASTNTQPWPLAAAGLVWVYARLRDDRGARFIGLGLALFLPFALFVANRDFAYRDLLPMVYLAYIAAAGMAARALRWAAENRLLLPAGAAAGLVLAVIGWQQTQELLDERLPHDESVVTATNWDNPLVRSLAGWLHEHVPEGSGVMSSRLYFSHLYVLDRGAHPVYQLPTVRVEPAPGRSPFLRPVTTLFRWEDHRMQPARADESWLYLRRYPVKGYYVALSEDDLLRDLRERSVDYLVLTGEDAGFSSLSYLDYFSENRAFELVYRDVRSEANGAYVFRVHRGELRPRPYRASVDAETLEALREEWPGTSDELVAEAIDPDGIAFH